MSDRKQEVEQTLAVLDKIDLFFDKFTLIVRHLCFLLVFGTGGITLFGVVVFICMNSAERLGFLEVIEAFLFQFISGGL